MPSIKIFTLLFLGATFTVGQNITCTENEIHTNCLDPCVPDCATPYKRVCNFLVCNEGCLCKPGYIKDRYSQGKCIPVSSCQEYCAPLQQYNECGPQCPQICGNTDPACIENSMKEKEVCVAGCYCKEGWIYEDVLGLCVKECPFG